jgi:hypothetical protein
VLHDIHVVVLCRAATSIKPGLLFNVLRGNASVLGIHKLFLLIGKAVVILGVILGNLAL